MNLYVITFSTSSDDVWLEYQDNYRGIDLIRQGQFEQTLGRMAAGLGDKEHRTWITKFDNQLVLADSITDALRVLDESEVAKGRGSDVVEIKLLASGLLCQRYSSIVVAHGGWIEGKV